VKRWEVAMRYTCMQTTREQRGKRGILLAKKHGRLCEVGATATPLRLSGLEPAETAA
jgi:hypothetical protein